jgi:hypothetical protein
LGTIVGTLSDQIDLQKALNKGYVFAQFLPDSSGFKLVRPDSTFDTFKFGFNWNLNGNSGTDTSKNFLGTTDNKPLKVKVNNIQNAIFDADRILKLNKGLYVGTENGPSGPEGVFYVKYGAAGSPLGYTEIGIRPSSKSFDNPAWQSKITTDGYHFDIVPGIYTQFRVFSNMLVTGNISAGYTVDPNAGYFLDVNGKVRTVGETLLSTQYGRVGVGTTSINEASILDLTSSTQGIKYPSLTTAQRNAINRGVSTVTILNGGSGYTTAPSISFSSSPTGLQARATTTITNGVVTGITITYPGSYNIDNATAVIASPTAGGTQATVSITMTPSRLPNNLTIFNSDAVASDGSVGVVQTWNGTAWKNNW